MGKYFPFLDWVKTYNASFLKSDISAGLTVGVMLVPQGMAYAMIAGMPPIYGLYASIVPVIIYALLGTSRQLSVGPVAMVSLLTASGVGLIATTGSENYIALAITLALLIGVIQFLLGLFRLGFLVNFLSHPVISGFSSAAALIIGFSQLKNLLGINIPRSHYAHEILLNAFKQFDLINWTSVAIGVVGIAIIILTKKISKQLPGQLFAVIFGILVVWGLHVEDAGVQVLGKVPSTLPSFSLPLFDWRTIQTMFPIALAISLVSFMQSIAVAKAIQSKHPEYKVVPNQELIALGMANIVGSFFQSFAITGSFSRTAVSDQTGAKTGFASIIGAFTVLLTLLVLTPLFANLPKAILASIIMVAVFGLIDYKEAIHLWKSHKTDFWLMITTFNATFALGIEKGIGLGVILSLATVIFRTTKPHVAVLGNVPGTHFYRNAERFGKVILRDEILIIRFDAQLYFGNVNFFKEKLEELTAEKGKKLRVVIINAESMNSLDSSAVHALNEIVDNYRSRHVEICFTGVKGPVRDAMERGGIFDKIGKDNFFMSIQEAVNCYIIKCNDEISQPKYGEYTTQANQ